MLGPVSVSLLSLIFVLNVVVLLVDRVFRLREV